VPVGNPFARLLPAGYVSYALDVLSALRNRTDRGLRSGGYHEPAKTGATLHVAANKFWALPFA
jgi:hypothetical protein